MSTGQEQIERVRRLHGDNWADFARRWIAYALRTEPIEPNVIGPYIVELYRAAGFAEPRVVVVSSPGVMAFAGAFSAEIWARRETDPTFDPARKITEIPALRAPNKLLAESTLSAVRAATDPSMHGRRARKPEQGVGIATLQAAYSPADSATANSLDRDDWQGIRSAVEEMEALSYWSECVKDSMRHPFGAPRPTEMLAAAIQDWAQPLALSLFGDEADAGRVTLEAANWWQHSDPGNMRLHDTACIVAAREIGGLKLPQHRKFAVWERCQVNGAYRQLHADFCLICDFPETLDETSMTHPTQVRSKSLQERRAAPVMRWSDGWLI
jgi:hypothetical protein